MTWYVRRLSRMSLLEIGHRAGRTARVNLERLGFLLAVRPPDPDIAALVLVDPIDVSGFAHEPYVAAADRLLAGEMSVFALQAKVSDGTSKWNTDPLTGTAAPLDFGKAIDYRDERVVGNIKYLWEPNRHLELVTLAQAWALTNEVRFLQGLARRLESWLLQCPYPQGANWASSLELGIRLINWSLVWRLIGGARSAMFEGAEGKDLRRRWLDSVYQHTHFIHHYYSRHSSANNHLIGEAAGVFVAACTWPCWPEMAKWGGNARRILIEQAEVQTHADGVNREQAVAYQQFVLDFLILAALAGRTAKQEFPRGYWQTVERMLEFLAGIMDVAGNVPMIGDADDGFVVRLSQEPGFCPFRSLLSTGAILFDRADFAASGVVMDDKTRFLVGAAGWPDLRARTPSDPTRKRRFPDGGYCVLGQDLVTDREIRLVADAGPLGFLSIAAHGHADALSFVLSVAGHEILVDPGTYSYHTEPRWREYFRGTGAHNTVRVDGQDQSVQGGNFMWLRQARACLEAFEYDHRSSRFVAEHDGYTRLSDPVRHRRELRHHGTMIEVMDRLACDGYHVVERCWHFSEQCRVSLQGSTVVAENGPVRVTLRSLETDCEIRHLRGSDDPPGGWVSRRFDVKVPADSLYCISRIQGTTELVTQIECEIRSADSLGPQTRRVE